MPFPNAPNTLAIANAIVTIQQGVPSVFLTLCDTQVTANASPQAVTPASMLGITVGQQLLVDVINPETVTVTAVTPTTFSAIFTKNHGISSLQWTIGTGPLLYNTVKLGAIADPTDVGTYCAITFNKGISKRYSSGWRVDAFPTFLLESGFDYQTSSTTAEQSLLTCRDVIIPIYLATISLNGTPGVYLTMLEEGDEGLYKGWPNGRIYRVHHLMVTVATQYNITVSN